MTNRKRNIKGWTKEEIKKLNLEELNNLKTTTLNTLENLNEVINELLPFNSSPKLKTVPPHNYSSSTIETSFNDIPVHKPADLSILENKSKDTKIQLEDGDTIEALNPQESSYYKEPSVNLVTPENKRGFINAVEPQEPQTLTPKRSSSSKTTKSSKTNKPKSTETKKETKGNT